MLETTNLLSIPKRPQVTKNQAVVMATRLFNLTIPDPSFVRELDGYDDLNFKMSGSLKKGPENRALSTCNEYLFKIVNQVDSSNQGLMRTQCEVMSFLQSRGYKCSTPVPSIFNTPFVMCKIPKGPTNDSVALATDGMDKLRFEIYKGEEYSKEQYFVCAVRLQTFVPGKLLNESRLSTHLLSNAGKAVGGLNRTLKGIDLPNLERPGFMWDLFYFGDKIEHFVEAIDDDHHVQMVQEVCEAFRKEVAPQLHLLPKQIIHGDANYTNILVTGDNGTSAQDFGFIDFGDVNFTCRVFELAIALMYVFNISQDLSCERSRMAGYFFAGYHLVNPLSDDEIKLLPVLIAARFCQSLGYGAFFSKHLYPDDEYIMATSKNGWKNFKEFWKLPKDEMLAMWLQIRLETEERP